MDREKAKTCISFLGQPMGRALHVKLKTANENWKYSSDDAGPAKAPEFVRELAILQSIPMQDSTSVALLIPFRFSDGIHHSMAVLIKTSHGRSSAEKSTALAACAADLKRSAEAAKSQPSISTLTIADNPGFDAALAAIKKPATRRPSLASACRPARANR